MRSRLPLVALAAAAAALTAGCGINDPYQPGATRTATTAIPGAAPEDEPQLTPAQRDVQRRAEQAARAFLAGYLPYSYGQATACARSRFSPVS